MRRKFLKLYWAITNPLIILFAGRVPWWVLLETIGRRTGTRLRTPLAAGPQDAGSMWLIAVHGRHADWVRNIEASNEVRVRHRRRWDKATATVQPFDESVVGRFNAYARSGPRLIGIDPVLVRLSFESGTRERPRPGRALAGSRKKPGLQLSAPNEGLRRLSGYGLIVGRTEADAQRLDRAMLMPDTAKMRRIIAISQSAVALDHFPLPQHQPSGHGKPLGWLWSVPAVLGVLTGAIAIVYFTVPAGSLPQVLGRIPDVSSHRLRLGEVAAVFAMVFLVTAMGMIVRWHLGPRTATFWRTLLGRF